MYRDFGTVFFAAIVAVIFVIVPLVIQWLIAPTNKTKEKLETYECGEVVEGSAWLQFNIRFYVIALIFLIFDVEVIFLYPWAVEHQEMALTVLWKAVLFIGILVLGLVYAWRKRALEWR